MESQQLSAYRIAHSPEHPKGILMPIDGSSVPPTHGPLSSTISPLLGRTYEENDLEEWIARRPASIFPDDGVEIIASQNYAHMIVKVDLLFLGPAPAFFVVEVKNCDVRRNGGVVPYDIYNRQMGSYLDFLRPYLDGYPDSHQNYYERFSRKFYGSPRSLPAPAHDIRQQAPHIIEVYLASGYDDYAIDYILTQAQHDNRQARLVFYRFFAAERLISFHEINPAPDRG